MENNSNKYVMSLYCAKTYNSLYFNTGNIIHCCMQNDVDHYKVNWDDVDDLNAYYTNNEVLKEIRVALDNGIKHKSCSNCWAAEKKYNHSWRFDDSRIESVPNIKFVDVRLSNKCNLQCKMCQPAETDQLVKLGLELKSKGIETPLTRNYPSPVPDQTKLFELILELPNLEKIRFAGGEPFIMPEVEEFLIKLVERNKTNIEVEFITNVTSAKPRILEILEKFKSAFLCCSIDGINDTIEYQRYPSKWKTIESNFIKFYNSKCKVSINPCISFLNYLDIHNFFAWANNFPKATVHYNEVEIHNFMNFRFIPEEIRQDFYSSFSKMKLVNAIKPWHVFQKKIMYETAKPTLKDCQDLKMYALTIWDYKCNQKFLDRYPWASYMLENI